MPRTKPDEYKPWKVNGHAVGYVRSGVYHIDRSIGGRRVRVSTGCVTRAAAEVEYKRFELSPAAYVTRAGRKAIKVTDPARLEQLRANHHARAYRMEPGDYDRMLVAQGGRCAICEAVPSGKAGRLDVDHDHASGKVRGLLCGACNRGMGALGDSPDLLRRAAEYLEASRALGSEWAPQTVEQGCSAPFHGR